MLTETTSEIDQLKVTFLGADPPIWRRLLVPANRTLAQLHRVLQIAMGWENQHLHEFRAGERRIGRPEAEGPFTRTTRVKDERTVKLSDVLPKEGTQIIYNYDFGDGWEHGIVLEKRLPAEAETTVPVCTDGERACPPEDCVGIPGYAELLQASLTPDIGVTASSAPGLALISTPRRSPSC
jgi:Plasmid pRiA4b ORF-3-like protein